MTSTFLLTSRFGYFERDLKIQIQVIYFLIGKFSRVDILETSPCHIDLGKFNICPQTPASCLKIRCEALTLPFALCISRSYSIVKLKKFARTGGALFPQ